MAFGDGASSVASPNAKRQTGPSRRYEPGQAVDDAGADAERDQEEELRRKTSTPVRERERERERERRGGGFLRIRTVVRLLRVTRAASTRATTTETSFGFVISARADPLFLGERLGGLFLVGLGAWARGGGGHPATDRPGPSVAVVEDLMTGRRSWIRDEPRR